MKKLSVVIIGAGIMGMSIGWQLAREKVHVHILEQRQAGRQASWAAAGMLAPYWEATCESWELLQMGEQSLALYPRYLQEVTEDSSLVIPKEQEGTLCVGLNRDDREWLQREYHYKRKVGMPLYWLSGEEARDMEPLLSSRVNAGIWVPAERHIDNRILMQALQKAFLTRGGMLSEKTKAVQIVQDVHKVLGVLTENERHIEADILINTAGAWADQLRSQEKNDSQIYIRPIKGQIINLKMSPNLLLKHMIRTPRIYFSPKQEGTLRVGATSEDRGFDEEATAGAALELLQNAWEVIPAISEYKMMEINVGLRPVSSHQMPLIGRAGPCGYYQAIGHGRSGILLAPYTAYTLKQKIWEDHFHGCSL